MELKRWNDLQSKRAVIHKRKRKARKLELYLVEESKKKLGHLRPVHVAPALVHKPEPEVKAKPKEGIFRRAFRRVVGA